MLRLHLEDVSLLSEVLLLSAIDLNCLMDMQSMVGLGSTLGMVSPFPWDAPVERGRPELPPGPAEHSGPLFHLEDGLLPPRGAPVVLSRASDVDLPAPVEFTNVAPPTAPLRLSVIDCLVLAAP